MNLQLCRTYEVMEISEPFLRSIAIILSVMKIILIEDDSPLWFNFIGFRNSLDDIQKLFVSLHSSHSSLWVSPGNEWKAISNILTNI